MGKTACLTYEYLLHAGDREIPACSNCRNAKPPKNCTFEALRIRQSVYSAAPEETSETPTPAAVAMAHGKPDAPATGEPSGDCEGISATAEVHAFSSSPTDTRGALFPQHSTSPPQATAYMNFTLPLNRYRSPPGSFHVPSPLGVRGNPQSPDSVRSAGTATSPTFLHTSPSRGPQPHRHVTDSLEQKVFEFYVAHAGPWVCFPNLETYGRMLICVSSTSPPHNATLQRQFHVWR